MKVSISGVRGVFGEDLQLDDVMGFADGFSNLIRTGRCVVGRDTRPSGPVMQEAAACAIQQNDVDVFDMGVAPTPAIFRAAKYYGAGIAITASHNPLPWNGLKFITGGRGINGAELETVKKMTGPAGGFGELRYVESGYVQEALDVLGRAEADVTVDVGGGAAAEMAPDLLNKIGCRVRVLNETLGSRGPDPTVDPLELLRSATRDCDVGFAFDLDGDRLVVVMDGKIQPPDATLALGVAGAIKNGCKRVVLSLDTSMAVERYVERMGGTVVRSSVGEANVVDAMIRTGAEAGGEGSSGGFIPGGFNHCRDGMFTAGLVSSMIGGPDLREVLDEVERYSQIRTKMRTGDAVAALEAAERHLRPRSHSIDATDGIKAMLDENTWVMVRPSNTEEVLRISAESDSLEAARAAVRDLAEALEWTKGAQ